MHADSAHDFLSCDWGTSTFRLRWISAGRVVREHSDDTGCKKLFDAWADGAARANAFEDHLRTVLSKWDPPVAQMSLIISGMASSSIGWKELPYASLPLNLDGSNLHVAPLPWNGPAYVSDTFLVSGAATEIEMMRGEETEAMGLINSLNSPKNRALLILPGTHSKHLRIVANQVVDIRTHMTGELYELLTKHSVLRVSVKADAAPDLDAFDEGVACAVARGLGAALFQTRTRQVLRHRSLESNASFLSGVLIGAELDALRASDEDQEILIAGNDKVRNLYTRAARQTGIHASRTFSQDEVQLAIPRAHAAILSRRIA